MCEMTLVGMKWLSTEEWTHKRKSEALSKKAVRSAGKCRHTAKIETMMTAGEVGDLDLAPVSALVNVTVTVTVIHPIRVQGDASLVRRLRSWSAQAPSFMSATSAMM